ncbi:hypothetical protein AKO1_005151 [Acrasis kona]|uniref:Uncharacterized protein n=1 Tax=Acrasis kona TaxID=1008807 RepID=A0AAW2Z4T0_9EUKA
MKYLSCSADRLQLAERIIEGVWSTYKFPAVEDTKNHKLIFPETNPQGLDLKHQYFHEPSCLHNEGVWHNCMMGLNYVLASKTQLRINEKSEAVNESLHKNLKQLNYDFERNLFRNRTHSPYWDHSTIKIKARPFGKHYEQDDTHCLNTNALSIIYWSFLTQGNIDIEHMWESIQKTFYCEEFNLYKKVPNVQKYRAIDHAILLLAAHLHCLALINDSRRQFLQKLILDLTNVLLNVFNYADPDLIKSYVVPCENENKNSSRIQRFAWQDTWIAITLEMLNVNVDVLTKNIYETFVEQSTGLLYNEPRVNGQTSWGASLCVFTGDLSLFYLLLSLQNKAADHPFSASFDQFLQDNLIMNSISNTCLVAESREFLEPSLWASSELTFALLMSSMDLKF